MCCKLYASILVALFVVDLGPAFAADQLRTRAVPRPGTSPQAAGPVANAETQGEAFFTPNRQHAALPGTSPRAPTPTTGENVQQPVVNGPIRNDPAVPTEEGGRPVQEPLEEVRPTESPVVAAPVPKNSGPAPGHFARGQAEPSRTINPVNNNIGQLPTNNIGGVREQPVQNTNPILEGNGEVRDSDMPRNLPQPTATAATTPNQRGSGGPTAFGGAIWPDFFRRPNVPTTNTGASDAPMTIPTTGGGQAAPLQNPHTAGPQSVPMQNPQTAGPQMAPMQNPQFGGGQGGQTSPTVDNLLDKLNTLSNLFGNNQGGGNGLGR